MTAFARTCWISALSATVAFWCTAADAQAPSISAISPRAVTPGETADVTLRGTNLAGDTQLWTSFPCEAALAPEIEGNGTKSDQVVFRLAVPANASLGIHALRVATPGGVSPPRLIVLDDLSSVSQQGDNTTPPNAQSLTLPVAVDGTMGKLSHNYYRFGAAAGQRLSFEVLSRRLGSALDPVIRLLDAEGRELIYSDDEAGLSADSRICYTFQAAGDYVLELRDIQYRGGGDYFYRLRIGDFPCVTVPYPMGAKRGSEVTLSFAGPDVEDLEPMTITVPSDPLSDWLNVAARRAGGLSSGFAVVALDDRGEFLEAEPNDSVEQANRAGLDTNLNGRFEQPGDVDRFVFSATKGQQYTFATVTRRQGSPSDLHLRLLNSDGSQVAEAEDTAGHDASLTYTFPQDGDYTLVVRDLSHRGGSEFAYRIEVKPHQAGFALSATTDRLNIPAGGVALVTVNAVRFGYNGPIAVSAVDLPQNVTSVPTVIGPGRNSVVLSVQAAPDAAAARISPIRVHGTATTGETDYQTTASVTAALRNTLNNMPFPPRILAESMVLAVAPEPQFVLKADPAKVTLGRHLSTTVKIVAERKEGFDEQIELAVTPEKDGLPTGVGAGLKPIEKGKNEVEITFSGNEKAPLGEFTATLVGTLKKDKSTFTQPAPGIGLLLDEPYRLSVNVGDGKLAPNGTLKGKVTVTRNPAFGGAIVLAVENLPNGVTVEAPEIPAGASEVEILLSANQDAVKGKVENVTVKGTAKVGEANLAASAPPASITVE